MAIPNIPMMAGWVARDSATQYSYRKVCSLVLALGSSLRAIGVPGDGKRELDSSGSHTPRRHRAAPDLGSHSHREVSSAKFVWIYPVDTGSGNRHCQGVSFEPWACTRALGRAGTFRIHEPISLELGLLGKSSVRALIWPTQDLHSHPLSMGLRVPAQAWGSLTEPCGGTALHLYQIHAGTYLAYLGTLLIMTCGLISQLDLGRDSSL